MNIECMCGADSTVHSGYSEYPECMLWSLQYTGYSEYGVYAVESTSTLDTVNTECMLWSLQYIGYSEYPECMLVESTVHWTQ